MKKLWRTLLAAGILSLVTCLFAGITVFAEKVGGESSSYSWTVDTETGTLLLTAGVSGSDGDALAWKAYQDTIHHVVMKDQVFSIDPFENLSDITMESATGFSWIINLSARTATMNGTGDWPENLDYMGAYEKLYDTIVIADGIGLLPGPGNSFTTGDFLFADRLVLGKNARLGSGSAQADIHSIRKSFAVSPENPYLAVYDDVLYSKDLKTIIACPTEKTSIVFASGVITIGRQAFSGTHFNPLIIPWGVQTLEQGSVSQLDGNPETTNAVVLPGTIANIAGTAGLGGYNFTKVYYLQNNKTCASALQGLEANGTVIAIPLDSLAQYYPNVPEAQGPGSSSAPTESKPESSAPASQPESKPESKPESSAPASSTPASQPESKPASKPADSSASSQPPESKPAPESSAPSSEPESSVAPVEEPSTEESSIAESSREESAAESSGESSASNESEETSEPEGLPTVERKVGGTMLVVLAVVLAAAGGAGIAVLVLKKGKK